MIYCKRRSGVTGNRNMTISINRNLANENGMTLAEVVAALALTSLLLGLLSQFLYTTVGLWSKNDKAYRYQHQLKYVYQTLANDFETVFTSRFLPEEPFQGEELQLSFWSENYHGLEQIRYRYDFENKTLWRSAGFWGSEPEARKLFTGISEWRFEYFEPKKRNWVLYWKPSYRTELPSLVKITARTELGVLGPLVFSIKARRNEED
ncbi:MAG: hypothetical protein ACM3YE_05655 [Bacteroidota bacterium]